MIVRMWEARIVSGQLDEFCAWVREAAMPQFAAAEGFLGVELFRAHQQQDRAVVVTRWSDADALAAGNVWFDLGVERFCVSTPGAWQFEPVPLA